METLLVSEKFDAKLVRIRIKGLVKEVDVENLWKLKLEKNPPINIRGRLAYQKRNIGFFSDDSIGYEYSGNIVKSQPLTRELKILMMAINKVFDENFNGVLVNVYENGLNIVGAHSDNEQNLGKSGVISISFGAERDFVIRDKKTKEIVSKIKLAEGDIIWMKGKDFQKIYTHEIPEDKNVFEPRLSLTFRHHLQ